MTMGPDGAAAGAATPGCWGDTQADATPNAKPAIAPKGLIGHPAIARLLLRVFMCVF
jgi:hypothetical protein